MHVYNIFDPSKTSKFDIKTGELVKDKPTNTNEVKHADIKQTKLF